MKRILIIEDEEGLIVTLTDRLENEGYTVHAAREGQKGFNEALQDHYDLILLDIMLPKHSGLDICRDLRSRGVMTPILMLTARGELVDKVLGFKLGADDYLVKPFEMLELLSRIEALLRRSNNQGSISQSIYKFGDFIIDFKHAQLQQNKQDIELSIKEFKLLQYLIENRGEIVTRDKLLQAVWGYDQPILSRTVDVHIAWLRQKIEENITHPKYIITVRGIGYKFMG